MPISTPGRERPILGPAALTWRDGFLADGAFAVLAYLTTSLGFATWYSNHSMNPNAFYAQYHHGIYRYRVLGREIVWWVYQHVVRAHFSARNLNPGNHGRLFPALLVVNGVAFVGFVLTMRALVRRWNVVEPQGTLIVWTIGLLAALSSFVVTPYDDLSYAFLGVFVLLALSSRWEARTLAVVVGVIGVLNRETMFIGLTILVAALSTNPTDRPLRAVTIGSAVAMAATYLLVRVSSSGSEQIWQSVIVGGQLTNRRAWIGVSLVVMTYLVWFRVSAITVLGAVPIRPLVVFYVLVMPYILVSVLTGGWFELRLVIPMIIGDFAVRGFCTSQGTTSASTAIAPV